MSLPADYSPSHAHDTWRAAAVPPAGEADLHGVLHDVGHGLFTLSLLLEQVVGEVGSPSGAELVDLLQQEMSRLLAVAHSGAGPGTEWAQVELRRLLSKV